MQYLYLAFQMMIINGSLKLEICNILRLTINMPTNFVQKIYGMLHNYKHDDNAAKL